MKVTNILGFQNKTNLTDTYVYQAQAKSNFGT